jgi:hypothetical protein
MKIILSIVYIFITGGLYGADSPGFDHFNAPGIVGAYFNGWFPFGMNSKGFDFEVGFYMNPDAESDPMNFWIGKKTKTLIEINSITAVNYVVADAFGGQPPSGCLDNTQLALKAIQRLLSIQMAGRGLTGFPLHLDSQEDLVSIDSGLRHAGLDEPTASLLLRLGKEYIEVENIGAKEWSAMWYEVDRLGGIERVTIRGSLKPVKVISVLHEAIFDAGTVNPSLLIMSNFGSFNLLR